MFNFAKVAERKIREALEEGKLDNLPGRGKPLELDDDRGVPEDLRLAYKILKNANCLPPELEAKNEIRRTEDLLAGLTDERERLKAIRRINFLVMKMNELRRQPINLEEDQRYYSKLVDKLTPGDGDKKP